MSEDHELRYAGLRQLVKDSEERELTLRRESRLWLVQNVEAVLEAMLEQRDVCEERTPRSSAGGVSIGARGHVVESGRLMYRSGTAGPLNALRKRSGSSRCKPRRCTDR